RNHIEETGEYLREIAKNMGVEAEVTTEVTDNHVAYHLSGDNIAILIGKRGRTLNSIQYLTQLVLNKNGGQFHSVIVDAEGYRERRKVTLTDLAHKMADKAQRINRK